MTAETLGKWFDALGNVLRPLRERWLLVVALASALFWTRDTLTTWWALPDEVDRHANALGTLTERIRGLEAVIAAGAVKAPPECDLAEGLVLLDVETLRELARIGLAVDRDGVLVPGGVGLDRPAKGVVIACPPKDGTLPGG